MPTFQPVLGISCCLFFVSRETIGTGRNVGLKEQTIIDVGWGSVDALQKLLFWRVSKRLKIDQNLYQNNTLETDSRNATALLLGTVLVLLGHTA